MLSNLGYHFKSLFFIFVGQKSEVANFHEAPWENMQKEAPDKLISSKGHNSYFIISFPVPVGKGDFTVVNRANTVV